MGKDKRRNSEKRKEKSRDAARCRRGKESEVFLDLADCLPLPDSVARQLDKASTMRLAISLLKIANVMGHGNGLHGNQHEEEVAMMDEAILVAEQHMKESKLDHVYQRALEGFTFILSEEGDFIYLSESVTKYLGLSQIELMGQSIYDFTHPCDHEEIKDVLTPKAGTGNPKEEGAITYENKTAFLRLKCTLTSKGRNVNLKSASYKVMKCSGRLMTGSTDTKENLANSASSVFPYLVGVAEPIAHPSNIEVPLDCSTFLSKHSMDMKFLVCDDRIQELAGYSGDEMIGKSFFDFTHALDSDVIDKVFKDLFSKGQAVTDNYRFLSRNGGYIWVVTQATVINNSRHPKPQFVVCVHYVVSGVEEQGTILSHVQKSSPLAAIIPPKMEMCTENIFAPRTKEMDTASFVPAELKAKIPYLNSGQEDLRHLAPSAGDDVIQIPFSPSNFLSSPAPSVENYVMKQEPATPSPDPHYHKQHSPMSLSSAASSRMASPAPFINSMVPVDVDSMGQFFQDLDGDNESTTGMLDNIDFAGRAPYIPMDGDEDLEIMAPSSNALFNFSNDVNPGLYGHTEKIFTPKELLFEDPEPQTKFQSIRDMIDGSTAKASIEQPPDTMCQQLKRPLDMNSLEKGPPSKKPARLDIPLLAQSCKPKGSQSISCKDSVLLNLLLNGEDRFHGYKVNSLPMGQQIGKTMSQSQRIPVLTSQDCEVNAPTQYSPLLQGAELIRALDIVPGKSMKKSQQ